MSDLHRPAHVPSVLVWGGWYGSRNIGDDAILLGIRELMRRVNPHGEYYLRALSTDHDHTSTFGVTGERALVRREMFQPWAWMRVARAFARADRVIISGGTPVFDSSHAIRTLYLLLPVLFRVPFCVFGAGIKPLRSAYGRRTVPAFLRRATYVSVRDRDSLDILASLGVRDAELTADSAFFAQPAPEAELQQLLDACDIAPDESLLVVAPRLLSKDRKRLYLQERMDDSLIERTPATLARAVDRLAPSFGRVVLMAMHFHGPDSDVPHIREIVRRTTAQNVTFIDRELRPDVAIALFRRAQLLIGVRLHALLLASSMGTPVVGIAYEQKVRSLFARLEQEEYCLDLFSVDEESLVATAQRALKNERQIRERLATRVAALRDLVLASAERALRLPPP